MIYFIAIFGILGTILAAVFMPLISIKRDGESWWIVGSGYGITQTGSKDWQDKKILLGACLKNGLGILGIILICSSCLLSLTVPIKQAIIQHVKESTQSQVGC
jgi:hypothetical protein